MAVRMSMKTQVSGTRMSSRAGAVTAPRVNRRVVACRAEEKPDGFVARDNSGKSNMYPTVPKPFEAGSSADTAADQSANLAYAGLGGVIAVLAVGAALLVGKSGPVEADYSEFASFKSLSSYRTAFAKDVGIGKAAPAPTPAPAPAVADE